MDGIAGWSLHFLDEHGQLALFLWLLLEEGGIPMPVPGDLVILVAGARVGQGQMNVVVALLLIESATLLGSSMLYWVARRGGRPMLDRYGKLLQLPPARLVKAEAFLNRRGFLAIVAGRLIPGLRIPTTVAAGVLGVPYLVFLPAAAVGSNNIVVFVLGLLVGPRILEAAQGISFSVGFLATVLGLAVVIAAYLVVRRRSHLVSAAPSLPEGVRLETALIAGLLATATTALVLNFVLYVLAALGQMTPTAALLELGQTIGRRVGVRPLMVLAGGITLHVVLQLLWAMVYAHFARRLPRPDWLGGLLFTPLPLAISLLIVLPALGAGVAGVDLGMGLVPLAGEVLRHVIYGWALSSSYTLLSRARTTLRPPGALRQPSAT
jgi:membrane protein DedA with SNARE-associated domain